MIKYEIEIEPEIIPIHGNLIVSGDDEFDNKMEDEVLNRTEHDQWAWCSIKVTASYSGYTGVAYLGCCNYDNSEGKAEEQFRADHYEDMKQEARDDLLDRLDEAQTAYRELKEAGFV